MHGRIAGDLFDRQRLGDDGHGRAVFGGDFIKIIGGADRACTGHIDRNHSGRARQVAADMARDNAAIKIVAAPRRIADIDGDRLSGEIRLLGHGGSGQGDESGAGEQVQGRVCGHDFHFFPLFYKN